MKSLYLLPVNAWVSALQAIMPGENTRPIQRAQKYNDLKAVYWQHNARLGAPSLVHDMHDLGYSMSGTWQCVFDSKRSECCLV